MSVPFPCAVYTRDRACEPYRFSHLAPSRLAWDFPASLSVRCMRRFRVPAVRARAHRAVFLVLVGGDMAQEVSLDTLGAARQRVL